MRLAQRPSTERSDLDFFVIVRPGTKPAWLANLDWLAAAHPLAWAFANIAAPASYRKFLLLEASPCSSSE
jgi:hypothetical protein